jgi:hypothetical protein
MKKFNILLANTSLNRQWHTLSLIIFNKKKKKEKLSIKTNNLRLTYIIVIEIIFSRNYSPELFDQSVFFHRIEYKHSTNDVVYRNMRKINNLSEKRHITFSLLVDQMKMLDDHHQNIVNEVLHHHPFYIH